MYVLSIVNMYYYAIAQVNKKPRCRQQIKEDSKNNLQDKWKSFGHNQKKK